MKRLLGFLMALVLLFGTALADDSKTFEPTFTNTFNYSASKWFSSDEYRALLTIMLSFDLSNEDDDFPDNALLGDSYVAYVKESKGLVVTFLVDDIDYTMIYVPHLDTAVYSEPSTSSAYAVEMAFEELGYTYYRNSLSTIMDVAKLIKKAIE